MNVKERLKIGLRLIFVISLIVMLAWEFIEPNDDKFRSFVRIVLWFIFLIWQIDYLIKKFKSPGRSTNESKA